jgi:hypothetical protein
MAVEILLATYGANRLKPERRKEVTAGMVAGIWQVSPKL